MKRRVGRASALTTVALLACRQQERKTRRSVEAKNCRCHRSASRLGETAEIDAWPMYQCASFCVEGVVHAATCWAVRRGVVSRPALVLSRLANAECLTGQRHVLSGAVGMLSREQPVLITRNGKVVAVLLAVQDKAEAEEIAAGRRNRL
jgi:hypothetical protein